MDEDDPWGSGNAWTNPSTTTHAKFSPGHAQKWSGSLGFEEADMTTSIEYESAWPSETVDSGWGASLDESGLEPSQSSAWTKNASSLDVWKAEVEGSIRTSRSSESLDTPTHPSETELPPSSLPKLETSATLLSSNAPEIDRALSSPLPSSPPLLPSSPKTPRLSLSENLEDEPSPSSPDDQAFGTFAAANEITSQAESVWTPPTVTSALPDATPGDEWGSAWVDSSTEDITPKDDWAIAREAVRRREERIPSHVVDALIEQWKKMANDISPIKIAKDSNTNDSELNMQLTESFASILENFIPNMTLPHPVQFNATHISKSVHASLKLTKNLPMTRSSPWSQLAIAKNTATWERSVRRELNASEDVGWFVTPKQDADVAPATETPAVTAKETKLGGILSYWGKKSTAPTATSDIAAAVSSSRSTPPVLVSAPADNTVSSIPSLLKKDRKSEEAPPPSTSRTSSPAPTPSLTSKSSASIASAPEESPARSSLDDLEPAPSAVSRFFNRFSRKAAPRHSPLSLSASDLTFLSDIPTYDQNPGGGYDDDPAISLQQMLASKPTKLPPPLAPPPKPAPRVAPPISSTLHSRSKSTSTSSVAEDALWGVFEQPRQEKSPLPPPLPPKPERSTPPVLPPPLSPSPASSRGPSRVSTPVTSQFPPRSQTPVLSQGGTPKHQISASLGIPFTDPFGSPSASASTPTSTSVGFGRKIPPALPLPPSHSSQSTFDDDGFGDFGDFISSDSPTTPVHPATAPIPPPKRSSFSPADGRGHVPVARMSATANNERRPSAPALLPPPLPAPLPPPSSSPSRFGNSNQTKATLGKGKTSLPLPTSVPLLDFTSPSQPPPRIIEAPAKSFPAPQGLLDLDLALGHAPAMLPSSLAPHVPRSASIVGALSPANPPQLAMGLSLPPSRPYTPPSQAGVSIPSAPRPPSKTNNVLSAQDLSFFENL